MNKLIGTISRNFFNSDLHLVNTLRIYLAHLLKRLNKSVLTFPADSVRVALVGGHALCPLPGVALNADAGLAALVRLGSLAHLFLHDAPVLLVGAGANLICGTARHRQIVIILDYILHFKSFLSKCGQI